MKKALKKRENRGQKNLQLYDCLCSGCAGCGSGHGSDDYENVRKAHRDYLKG